MPMRSLLRTLLLSAIVITSIADCSRACTSAIVSAKVSASGKPFLWKQRDTSTTESNYIGRVEPTADSYGYIALFNAGDSLMREAWIGVNDVDFAIMNTASFNLPPNSDRIKDREGLIMSEALKHCATVDDFAKFLITLPKPMGARANFGVIDADGNGAFFETDDFGFKRFDLSDAPDGVLIRTNFSLSGKKGEGHGYERYDNAAYLLADKIAAKSVCAEDFTEDLARSFYSSKLGRDLAAEKGDRVPDKDFIPRFTTVASVVIEGAQPADHSGKKAKMHAALGYPPVAITETATVDAIPTSLLPTLPGYKSQAAEQALARKYKAFKKQQNGSTRYINMSYLREIMPQLRNNRKANNDKR